MLASGISPLQIANSLKMRRETFARWQKIPEFMYEYEKLMDEVRLGLRNKVTMAINASLERITYEVGDSSGNPKRLEAFLKIIEALENKEIIAR